MARAGIYVRISRDLVGQALGVKRQLSTCVELASRYDLGEPEVFSDNDVRATIGSKPRPEYQRLWDKVRQGQLDKIVCWHPDRLWRNPWELEEFLKLAREQKIRIWIYSATLGALDLENNGHQLMLRVVTSVAAYEPAQSAARKKAGQTQRVQHGRSFKGGGWRTYGWELDRMTQIPAEAAMIKEWHQRIHAGDSAYRLAVEANEAGLPTVGRAGNPGHRAAGLPKIAGDRGTNPAKWARPTIVKILRNPIHCGLQTYKGQLARDTENGEYVKGQWEPIIDVKTWETTCALLDNRPVRRGSASNKVKYLLSGLVACGKCDGPLYPKQVRNEATRRAARRRDVPPRLLYTCINFCTAIDMQYLDRYVEAFLLGTADSDGWLMVLQNRECGEPADLQSEIDKLGSVVRQVEDVALNKRAGLPGGDDDSTYGRLSVEALDRNVMQWALKRNTLIAKQAEANRPSPVDTVTRATWNEAPLDRRRSVIFKVLRIKVLPLKTGAGFKPGKVELSLHGEKWSAQAKAIAAIAAEVVQNERRPAKATRDRVYSPRACEYCGTQFMAVSSRGRYCSRRCGYLGLRAERKQEAAVAAALRHLTCAVCGAKFTQRPVGRVALFCSRRCKYEAAEAARKRRAA